MTKYLILLIPFLIISCSNKESLDLSYSEKVEDFEYLCNYFKSNSPFQEYNSVKYSIPHLDSVYGYYIQALKKSKDDTSFIQIIQAVLELGGRSGHSDILTTGDISFFKTYNLFHFNPTGLSFSDFSRGKYWRELYNSLNYFCHAPFLVDKDSNGYFVDSEWIDSSKNIAISAGSRILKVNGHDCISFMDSTIEHSWFNYYTYNKEWVREFLFVIDCGSTHKGWNVEFEYDGVIKKHFVPKLEGKTHKQIQQNETIDNCICIEISDNIGYIKSKSFLSQYYRDDKRKIKQFFEFHSYQFDTIIIDLRGNNGGDQNYGYNLLISPFLNQDKEIDFTIGFTQNFINNTTKEEINFYKLWKNGFLNGKVRAIPIDNPQPYEASPFKFYKTTKKIEAKNTYPFNGKIIVLIDGGVFSATEDFILAFKRLKMGITAGEKTGGGAAGYIMSPIVRLPNSGILVKIETEFLLNEDGKLNEVERTKPDIYIESLNLPNSLNPEEIYMTLRQVGLISN